MCVTQRITLKREKAYRNFTRKTGGWLNRFSNRRKQKSLHKTSSTSNANRFIDRFIEGVDIPAVLLDNFSAMDTAVETFRKQPIAIITTSLALPITPRVERLEGFRQALRNRNLLIDERYIKMVSHSDDRDFNQLFTLEQPPRGIIAANDRIFQELMLYIKKETYMCLMMYK